MASLNENIEKLINRRLDGALNADEELELDRELLRNPEARRVMEEYRKIDRIAAVALSAAVALRHAAPAMRVVDAPRGFQPRWWFVVPGAVAAALLALVIPKPALLPEATDSARIVGPIAEFPRSPSSGLMRAVSSPASVQRDTGREVIGVVDETGNIYWIEVDRTWTVKTDPWSDVQPTARRNLAGGV